MLKLSLKLWEYRGLTMATKAQAIYSEFNAEGYRVAAMEHIPIVSELYDRGQYVLANYLAGLSVECIFRAYRVRFTPEFDARHDLRQLFKQSKFAELFPASRSVEYDSYVGIVAAQWANSHRYRSEKTLRTFLRNAGLHRTVKRGDYLKELTRRIVHAAAQIVNIGERLWPRKVN